MVSGSVVETERMQQPSRPFNSHGHGIPFSWVCMPEKYVFRP